MFKGHSCKGMKDFVMAAISNFKQMRFSDDNVLCIKAYIFNLCTLKLWWEISSLMYASLAAGGWGKSLLIDMP